jgi:hypothetical protein
MSLGNDINLSRHMTHWHLIRWFLNLDLLIADKFALLNLQYQLTLDLILFAPHTRAFDFGSECFLVDDLIHFHTARITSINSYLHARLDITASGNDTFHIDQ